MLTLWLMIMRISLILDIGFARSVNVLFMVVVQAFIIAVVRYKEGQLVIAVKT